ncbi:hypothetical protein CEXT_759671 [Caerostris extrusa]|uniref:Uncharacterized protein n=1 Tax=Caerostris extrusa TaxID=172846 RepID=A0AAV4MZ78_CAEEX|nr:hypothetical protein CEXT_759671 [Caerostris extrusa]
MTTWTATGSFKVNCNECSPKRDVNTIVFAPSSEQGMNTPGISLQAASICPGDKRRMGGRDEHSRNFVTSCFDLSRRQKKNGRSLGEAEADGGLCRAVVIYLETIAVTATVWRANGVNISEYYSISSLRYS